MSDKYNRLIKAIVEGQVKNFIDGHPSILEGVIWFKPSTDKRQVLINSISRRIIQDLTCENTINKIRIALMDGLLSEQGSAQTVASGANPEPGPSDSLPIVVTGAAPNLKGEFDDKL